MINQFLLLSLISTVVAFPALAANEVRNGGDAVVCFDANHNIESVEVLDVFETRTFAGFTLDLGAPSVSVEDKFKKATAFIDVNAPLRAKIYQEKFDNFFQNTTFVGQLTDVPDSYHVAIPENCELQQLAVFSKNPMEGLKPYLIRKTLWDRLDNDNKTALLLHEIAYREAKMFDHPNSLNVRRLVAHIISGKVANLSLMQYLEFLTSLRWGSTDIQGVEVDLFWKVDIMGRVQGWLEGCKEGKRLYDWNNPDDETKTWNSDGSLRHGLFENSYCPVSENKKPYAVEFPGGYFFPQSWDWVQTNGVSHRVRVRFSNGKLAKFDHLGGSINFQNHQISLSQGISDVDYTWQDNGTSTPIYHGGEFTLMSLQYLKGSDGKFYCFKGSIGFNKDDLVTRGYNFLDRDTKEKCEDATRAPLPISQTSPIREW